LLKGSLRQGVPVIEAKTPFLAPNQAGNGEYLQSARKGTPFQNVTPKSRPLESSFARASHQHKFFPILRNPL
jgi:hypothetical protein